MGVPIDPIVVGKPFTIEIERCLGGVIGMNISWVSRDDATLGLYVKSIKEDGLVHAWNVAHPSNMVCVGDRVLSVNGHAFGEQVYAGLKKYTLLSLEFIREVEQPFTEDRLAKRSESPATKAENPQEA